MLATGKVPPGSGCVPRANDATNARRDAAAERGERYRRARTRFARGRGVRGARAGLVAVRACLGTHTARRTRVSKWVSWKVEDERNQAVATRYAPSVPRRRMHNQSRNVLPERQPDISLVFP